MFRGANPLTLDAKGRMVMPTRYRERLQERCGGKLVVTIDKDECLLIYPAPDWGMPPISNSTATAASFCRRNCVNSGISPATPC